MAFGLLIPGGMTSNHDRNRRSRSRLWIVLLGCGLYALAVITGLTGVLLQSSALSAPSLIAGGVVLAAAAWYHATAISILRHERTIDSAAVVDQAEVLLKRAS